MINTILQIMMFIAAILLIILCFVQANKGQSVLNGLTSSSSLFQKTKDDGFDKKITLTISGLAILIFLLTLIESHV